MKEMRKIFMKLSSNTKIVIYLIAPYLLGLLFSDVLSIDISNYMKRGFGLLNNLEMVGYPIQTKSMILFFNILVFPISYQFVKPRLKNNVEDIANGGSSNVQLIFFILFGIFCVCVCIYLYVHGTDFSQYLNGEREPNRTMRLILTLLISDIGFMLFTSFIIFGIAMYVIAIPRLLKALFIRLGLI